MQLGVYTLPEFPKDPGDSANRTSPLAFTATAFEFAPVGSNQSVLARWWRMNTILLDSPTVLFLR